MTEWIPINRFGLRPGETWPHEEPPMAVPILMWNATANMRHGAGTYRVGVIICENTSDCTHWMPYHEGMELPDPPEDWTPPPGWQLKRELPCTCGTPLPLHL